MAHIDLERLVSAGLLDYKFRELLLRDPLRAAEGYYQDRFRLSGEEKTLLTTVPAGDFQTFVNVIAEWITNKRTDQPAVAEAYAPADFRFAESPHPNFGAARHRYASQHSVAQPQVVQRANR
jgi:hypothetical protein